jgi:alpha-methylacyl-CoA racemase
VAPALSFTEAQHHPHLEARKTFIDVNGVRQPAPAPRFSRTPAQAQPTPPGPRGADADRLLDWGFTAAELADLRAAGALH